MQKILLYVIAGMIGGAFSFLLISGFKSNHEIIQQAEPKAIFTNVSATNAQPFDFVEASEKSKPAVVHISAAESNQLAQQRFQSKRNQGQNPFGNDFFGLGDFFGQNFLAPKQGTGSGVIISEDGYIVTNNHVVGFADELKVNLPDGREFMAKKIGTDPSSDLAVIKIESSDLPTLSFSESENVKVGEWVLAIGNPFSYLSSTVTAGIVSALGRDLDLIEGKKTIEEFIQTDAAVNPGNSGGALVDASGNLIGINTAIATPTGVFAGYSFAIPSSLAKRIVDDIIENGNIERANLGIQGFDMDAELAKQENIQATKGIYVAEVIPGSGAQFSGILPGDVVIGINGKEVNNFEDITKEMRFTKVGDMMKLKIIRNNKEKEINVKIRKDI